MRNILILAQYSSAVKQANETKRNDTASELSAISALALAIAARRAKAHARACCTE